MLISYWSSSRELTHDAPQDRTYVTTRGPSAYCAHRMYETRPRATQWRPRCTKLPFVQRKIHPVELASFLLCIKSDCLLVKGRVYAGFSRCLLGIPENASHEGEFHAWTVPLRRTRASFMRAFPAEPVSESYKATLTCEALGEGGIRPETAHADTVRMGGRQGAREPHPNGQNQNHAWHRTRATLARVQSAPSLTDNRGSPRGSGAIQDADRLGKPLLGDGLAFFGSASRERPREGFRRADPTRKDV